MTGRAHLEWVSDRMRGDRCEEAVTDVTKPCLSRRGMAHQALQVIDHLPVQRRRTATHKPVPGKEIRNPIRIITQQFTFEEGAPCFDQKQPEVGYRIRSMTTGCCP